MKSLRPLHLMRPKGSFRWVVAGFSIAALATLGWAASASAQSLIAASPDITIGLGSPNVVTADEDVLVDNQAGVTMLESLGSLPASADVVAFGVQTNGDRLFSLDTAASLGGGVARPGDVMRYDGASYSKEFDASGAGVPNGVQTDAVSLAPGGLLLSFDTTVSLPGSVVAADEDVVLWDGSTFSMVIDGSALGLASELDVDAVSQTGIDRYMISLDTTATVGGITVADEDLLQLDGSTWSLYFDASASDADWSAADLSAVMVPEPGTLALLAWGTFGTLGLIRVRRG